ncbi:hypothetical protein DTL42_07970 [Bremerella cremea]|uniref:Uncharacterized protein n=1 Tax=Bremerella cremea TaxID=1031537 RepID=A0A368KV31_9BACT|nr:hypothetical protein [Bremerella cremea]RCS52764.1 hypothetical protein DTL42_07970 [Bremerella cremea]
MTRLLLTLAILCCAARSGYGSNNYFLPGDAFFHATLTQESIEALAKQKVPRVIGYSFQDTFEGAFCGYAGYSRARVPAMNDKFVANLKWTYDHIRETDGRELRESRTADGIELCETNGLHMFLVRDDFDLSDSGLRLGLKYNENWIAETKKFVDHARLCCFVDTAQAVEACWVDGPRYPGLEVKLPAVELESGQPIDEPVEIEGNVKAIVMPAGPLKPYFQREEDRYIYVVTEKEVVTYYAEGGRWKVFDEDDFHLFDE